MEPDKAAFMGKVTAGITHELKNVLAIIKESVGLMEDLIALDGENAFPDKDRFLLTMSRIMAQVTRGVDLSTRLNGFAHSADETKALVDLSEAVELTGHLCRRPARLKGMTVNAVTREEPETVMVDPMVLQMMLYQSVEWLTGLLSPGAGVNLEVAHDETSTVIISTEKEARRGDADGPDALQWETLEATARFLDASVEKIEGQRSGMCIRFLR